MALVGQPTTPQHEVVLGHGKTAPTSPPPFIYIISDIVSCNGLGSFLATPKQVTLIPQPHSINNVLINKTKIIIIIIIIIIVIIII